MLLAGADTCRTIPLELNSTVNGALTADDCRYDLAVGGTRASYLKQYSVTLREAGVLTLRLASGSLDTYLWLRDAEYLAVTQNNDSGGTTDSRVAIGLEAGTYYVLAGSAAQATGIFTLSAAFETPRNCAAQDLTFGPTAGAFVESGCRILDLETRSTDESYVNVYRVAVPQKSVLTLTAASPRISPFLYVFDGEGWHGAEASETDPSTARLAISLAAGTYQVWMSQAEAGVGAYTLTAVAGGLRSCPVKEFTSGAGITGDLKSDGCRYLDYVLKTTDETLVDVYRIATGKVTVANITLRSAAVDAYLELDDLTGYLTNNDDAEDGSTDSRILTSLNQGTYYILAGEYSLAAGSYTLTAAFEDPRPCPVTDLTAGGTLAAKLDPNGCRLLDMTAPSEDATPVSVFRVAQQQRKVATFNMVSPDFDAYLGLFDSALRILADDDDSGGGTDANLDVLLDPATYLVLAMAADSGSGRFELKKQERDPRQCPLRTMTAGATVENRIEADGCGLKDFLAGFSADASIDINQVTVEKNGTLFTQTTSTEFAPLLLLLDQNYQLLAYEFGTLSATVATPVTPGKYYIVVAAQTAQSGGYKLFAAF